MKIKKFSLICIIATFLTAISLGCSSSDCSESARSRQEALNVILEEGVSIQEAEFFRVVQYDSQYYCLFYNQFYNVVRTEGPLAKIPTVDMVNEKLARFTLQSGTGRGTQWGYYYDVDNNQFSDVFYGICDQWAGKVIYINVDKVVIRDIFDQAKYYREFSYFGNPLSDAAEPIVNAEFLNNGSQVQITYLTGAEYIAVMEVFEL